MPESLKPDELVSKISTRLFGTLSILGGLGTIAKGLQLVSSGNPEGPKVIIIGSALVGSGLFLLGLSSSFSGNNSSGRQAAS